MLSDIESRIFVWVKYTGEHHSGDWYSCKNSERIRYLLQVLDIEYTIKDRSNILYFSWLHNKTEWSWDINITAAIDEIRVISCMNLRSRFRLSDNEQLIFIFQASQISETAVFKSNGELRSVYKSFDSQYIK